MEQHSPLDPQPLGGIAGTGYDTAFADGNDGPAFQFRVDDLFAVGEKGISVNVEDSPWSHMQSEHSFGHAPASGERS